jgi:hypothetical protein
MLQQGGQRLPPAPRARAHDSVGGDTRGERFLEISGGELAYLRIGEPQQETRDCRQGRHHFFPAEGSAGKAR